MTAIILIGVPGSVQSTIGRSLAAELGLPFVDTDILAEHTTSSRLETLLSTLGKDHFLEIEQDVILILHSEDAVNSTGGSVVRREAAMRHLRGLGLVVFLHVGEADLVQRAGDLVARGVVRESDASDSQLLDQRPPLHCRHCDVEVDASETPEAVPGRVLQAFNRSNGERTA